MIARMWETRLRDGSLDAFCEWIGGEAWPALVTTDGFLGGEVYRSDAENRAVVITRWVDEETLLAGNEWFDLGAERFTARAPHSWDFTPVPTGAEPT
jgi:heme-degrading monooxygenase HmoA